MGDVWEDLAAEYLRGKGYEILARNVRTRRSDLDIVASDGETLLFVEVKARKTKDFGGPGAFITQQKQDRLVSCAKEFLVRRGWWGRPCRFDAVLIYSGVTPPEIEHVKNAFEERAR
jgi:putative endonuclease